MQNKLYRFLVGKEIFTIDEDMSIPIIEDLINEEDYVLLVAEEKQGKTILAQQLACSLSSGTPFLDTFSIPKPVRVWYFATEGKTRDLQERFINIAKKIPTIAENLVLIPTLFRFNTPEGLRSLKEILATQELKPKIIIIDALYRAVKGSIKDDDVVNEFNHIVGWLQQECQASVLLVHHMTKPQRTINGDLMERSDKDTFGSAFLLAAVDHILWIEKWRKDKNCPKDRFLRCDTQRSGKVFEGLRLRLTEPSPLYFSPISTHTEEREAILAVLKANLQGVDMTLIQVQSKVKRSTLFEVMSSMLSEGIVLKEGQKTKIYRLKEGI